MKQLDPEQLKLLRNAVEKHDPTLIQPLDRIGTIRLTVEQRDALRETVAAELCDRGLGANDEPNDYGFLLENLIDGLGHA